MAVSLVFEYHCKYDMFGNCSALTSIRQIGQQQPGVFQTQVWNYRWLNITNGGVSTLYSLSDIEIDHLRCPPNGWIADVKIHSAIVCASISCPDLRNSAFIDKFIEQNLTDSMVDFLSHKQKGAAIINNKLWVSQIFSFFSRRL